LKLSWVHIFLGHPVNAHTVSCEKRIYDMNTRVVFWQRKNISQAREWLGKKQISPAQ